MDGVTLKTEADVQRNLILQSLSRPGVSTIDEMIEIVENAISAGEKEITLNLTSDRAGTALATKNLKVTDDPWILLERLYSIKTEVKVAKSKILTAELEVRGKELNQLVEDGKIEEAKKYFEEHLRVLYETSKESEEELQTVCKETRELVKRFAKIVGGKDTSATTDSVSTNAELAPAYVRDGHQITSPDPVKAQKLLSGQYSRVQSSVASASAGPAVSAAPSALSVDKKDLAKLLVEAAEKLQPELFSKFYPKQYEGYGNYHSPKLLAAVLSTVMNEFSQKCTADKASEADRLLPSSMQTVVLASNELIDKKMPIFYISPALIEAIFRTDFSDKVRWTMDSLKLPFEAGAFMLPRGMVRHSQLGDLAFVVWTRNPAGIFRSKLFPNKAIESPCETFALVGLLYDTANWIDCTMSALKRPEIEIGNLYFQDDGPVIGNEKRISEEEDKKIMEALGIIAFGSFLAMNAQPKLCESAAIVKVIPAKSNRPRREFWTPNVIGREYQIKRQEIEKLRVVSVAGGPHTSPRAHYRRGHFRNTVYGRMVDEVSGAHIPAERRPHKTDWIEPVWVG